ncbi:MAG: substrate-binding domain-containing protein [Nitrospira sp.]|nr:substrate-binding domain-containing protein [Nitrospira sp.]
MTEQSWAKEGITITNREPGSGARNLLDGRLKSHGLKPAALNGYGSIAGSHIEVARRITAGVADAGIGLRAVAKLHDLGFTLQEERYDLVIPSALLDQHPTLPIFLDTVVSRSFRSEIEALRGYNTRETGTVHELTKDRSR